MPWLLNTAVIDQGEQLNPRFPMLILCCVARASCLLVLLLFFEFIPVQEICPLPSTLCSVVSLLGMTACPRFEFQSG